jgi:hypothetical protein
MKQGFKNEAPKGRWVGRKTTLNREGGQGDRSPYKAKVGSLKNQRFFRVLRGIGF